MIMSGEEGEPLPSTSAVHRPAVRIKSPLADGISELLHRQAQHVLTVIGAAFAASR